MFYLICILLFFLVAEIYTFQAIKTLIKNKWVKISWIFITFIAYSFSLYILFTSIKSTGQTYIFQLALGVLITIVIPKFIIIVCLFIEDIIRIFKKTALFIFKRNIKPIAGRRKFISQLALGLAAIPFSGFLYGIIRGKYLYKVLKYELSFTDLPKAFHGFTITHISDIHAGSLTNKKEINYGVDLINQQQSDVILFTGDLVNFKAKEMRNWVDTFKKLIAPFGKFSVLGNHDYGPYIKWKTPEKKQQNFENIKKAYAKIGFQLLNNESLFLKKEQQKIALIGVENWGKSFIKKGDLKKASKHVQQTDFKILLSHDPSHWEIKVKDNPFNYQLTLSGHTHGGQMGIEIPGVLKWSPIQYIYKYWAGLYKEYGRYLNVNRGFGYHAFPGRIGIWPEITVITLKKA